MRKLLGFSLIACVCIFTLWWVDAGRPLPALAQKQAPPVVQQVVMSDLFKAASAHTQAPLPSSLQVAGDKVVVQRNKNHDRGYACHETECVFFFDSTVQVVDAATDRQVLEDALESK